jgi:hypothetical protein
MPLGRQLGVVRRRPDPNDGSGVASRVISAHITTADEHSSTRSEPAFRASSDTSAYVPIGRAWPPSSGDVLCARSVPGGQEHIGRSVSGLDCEEVPGSGNAFEFVFSVVFELDA